MSKQLCFIAIRFAAILFASIAPGILNSAEAREVPAGEIAPQNGAEEFVLRQLSMGNDADLNHHDQQTLRAEFISALLTGKISNLKLKLPRIAILHAQIEGRFSVAHSDVPYQVLLNSCVFKEDVDLTGTHFLQDLSFVDSHFQADVQAEQLRVEKNLNIRWAHFYGEVDFAAATIGGFLYAAGMETLQPEVEAEFEYSKVGVVAEFSNSRLSGPLKLAGADLQVLLLKRDHALANEPDDSQTRNRFAFIDLEGAAVHRDLEIVETDIGILNAPALEVLGKAIIQDISITGEVDFEGAHFEDLSVGDTVAWPGTSSSIRLSGITFSRLGPEYSRKCSSDSKCVDASWRRLLDAWVDRAEYSPQAYQQLETAFDNAGRSTLGDETFVKMKRRERADGHLTFGESFFNWIECWVIGYGREPQFAVYWSLPFIALGYFIFRRKYMRQVKPDDKLLPYNAFWYSFELFLPLVKLQCAEFWVPHDSDHARIFYMRFHSMMGWVLVPFAIAALTGLVHGR